MGLIRIILACFVVIYHCGQFENFKMMQGPEAVQSFYIISGFYMALILNEKYHLQVNSYRLFVTNRLLKLMPIYWFMVLLIILVSLVTFLKSDGNNLAFFQSFKNQTFSFGSFIYLILSNIFIVGQDFALFMGFNSGNGHLFFTSFYDKSTPPVYSFMLVPQAWTISIEIMFYIIAPFFVRKKIWVIALLACISLGIKFILHQNGLVYDPWSYRFFPAELFFFLLGVLSYKLYVKTKKITIPKWVLLCCFGTTLCVIIAFNTLLLQFHHYVYFICFSFVIPFIFRVTQKNKWDRLIGDYSYPIYITHVFFKSLYYMVFGYSLNVSIPVIIASILFALVYNQFINKRLERFRQKRVLIGNLN